MKTILLSQGKVALVDDADYASLCEYKWYAGKRRHTYYAMSKVRMPNSKWQTILMHRLILNTPRGVQTDHRNRDGLDNRRSNLRFCTHAENQRHRKLNSNNKSGFKGVYIERRNLKKPCRVHIKIHNKVIHLGSFESEIVAARAYDKAAIEFHGEFAETNKMLGLL